MFAVTFLQPPRYDFRGFVLKHQARQISALMWLFPPPATLGELVTAVCQHANGPYVVCHIGGDSQAAGAQRGEYPPRQK